MHEEKERGSGLTTLEAVLNIDTLVGLLCELRTPKDTTGGITLLATSVLLPLVSVTPVWALARARGESSALSPTFLVRGRTDAFSSGLGVTITAVKVAWVVRGANRSPVIRVVTGVSPFPDLRMQRSADGGSVIERKIYASAKDGGWLTSLVM